MRLVAILLRDILLFSLILVSLLSLYIFAVLSLDISYLSGNLTDYVLHRGIMGLCCGVPF